MYDTVALDETRDALVIIDQTKLPAREELLFLTSATDIHDAIYHLNVRGAPAIGVAAAIGIYLEAKAIAGKLCPPDAAARSACTACTSCVSNKTGISAMATGNGPSGEVFRLFLSGFMAAKRLLNSARPTAVNLSWALDRMERAALSGGERPLPLVIENLKLECAAIIDEDIRVCEAIGRHGLELLSRGMSLLTHCNAGRLATASPYGTATAPIYYGHAQGYGFTVFCGETRPLLQGARLTAYELSAAGVNTTLICDNMVASLMAAGQVDAVLVGCDRVAANGDTANKIGTSYVAIAAARFGIPFYVCAPTSTIDMSCPDGRAVNIERRPEQEVTELWFSERMAPPGVKVYNPAFDITEGDGLITAIITEHGVAHPPYRESLAKIKAQ